MVRNDYGYPDQQDLWQRAKWYVIPAVILTLLFGFILLACAEPAVVAIAKSEIGHGETVGDNQGQDIKRYGGRAGDPWCAAFVSYCFKSAGVDIPFVTHARDFLKIGRIVERPQAGDVIVFWRGSKDSQAGHVGIVAECGDGFIKTIEGNVGEFPARVKIITYKGKPARLLGFVRIR